MRHKAPNNIQGRQKGTGSLDELRISMMFTREPFFYFNRLDKNQACNNRRNYRIVI